MLKIINQLILAFQKDEINCSMLNSYLQDATDLNQLQKTDLTITILRTKVEELNHWE